MPSEPATGVKVAQFRILDRLGQGGMGVVYKALDERLDRVVALKVLPPEVLADDDRKRRFLREAKAAAAVNHAHIATVYEVGESDGQAFIAMELVSGQSLRKFCAGRPLGILEALRLAIEMCEGLAKAHQAGVVHRDLKPDNVMVTDDDHVKILDFGLAKVLEPARQDPARGDEGPLGLQPTEMPVTQEGKVLGTPGYMSPEQTRGRAVDHRSDYFSFGVLLYEIVTGRLPFTGETTMDIALAIVGQRHEPASQRSSLVPADLDRILDKCLEKDPADRYQDARDLLVDLRRLKRDVSGGRPALLPPSGSGQSTMTASGGMLTPPPSNTPGGAAANTASAASSSSAAGTPATPASAPSTPPSAPARGLRAPLSAAAAVAAVAAVAFVALRNSERKPTSGPAPPPIAKRAMALKRITSSGELGRVFDARISPDGRYLAYLTLDGTYLRLIETGDTRMISPESGYDLVWSPDGMRLLVSNQSSIYEVNVVSGARRAIADGGVAAISPDGSKIAYRNEHALWVMSAEGKDPRRLADLFESGILDISWSPDGRRLVFVNGHSTKTEISVRTIDLDGHIEVLVTDNQLGSTGNSRTGLVWAPDGRIIYSLMDATPGASGANLWALTIDPATGKAAGDPVKVSAWAGFGIDGLSVSQDGRRLVFHRTVTGTDIYIGDVPAASPSGGPAYTPTRFTLDEANDRSPVYAADGRLIFSSDRRGGYDILIQDPRGGPATPLTTQRDWETWPVLSPDGKQILFWEIPAEGATIEPRLMAAPLDGGTSHEVLRAQAEAVKSRAGLPPPTSSQIACSYGPKGRCVLGETIDKEVIFSEIDPQAGRGRRLATVTKMDRQHHGYPSPDGESLAVLVGSEILMVSLKDDTQRRIPVGIEITQYAGWSPDGRALFVTGIGTMGRFQMLRLSTNGEITRLWDSPDEWMAHPAVSADGKRLAVTLRRFDTTFWMVENF